VNRAEVRVAVEMRIVHDWNRDVEVIQQLNQHRTQFSDVFSNVAHPQYPFNLWLRVWKKCAFSFEKNGLSVHAKFRVAKLFRAPAIDEFAVPTRLTPHAVRVLVHAEDIFLNTRATTY
jgi:hypothetical protein